jgi:hypothetical protein
MAARVRGQDTPSEPQSSLEDEEDEEEEGDVTPPPHSPPCEALLSLGDIFRRQAGITVDAYRPEWTSTKTGPSTNSLP